VQTCALPIFMAEEDVDELEPTPDDPAVAKQLANRFGRRARRDVEVFGRAAQVEVADAAAHEIGLVAGAQESTHHSKCVAVHAAHETLHRGSWLTLAHAGCGSSITTRRHHRSE